METYDLNFDVWKINCDNFKQRQISIITTLIAGGRLWGDMKFKSYANIKFDETTDPNHLKPHITLQEDFNRIKTNCLVYDLLKTKINPGKYDKCFIYQTNGIKTNGFYGFIFYNSETGQYRHKYYINRNDGDLLIELAKIFATMRSGGNF